MRLHRLRAQAFGPFAQPVEVDFDTLGEAGLFLVHGPTGAGKSSLLDAVCFALYAGVPGARRAHAKSLVSDHVPQGTVPAVELEFTVSGRRFRVVRSPEFWRPKKRGTGLVSVQAKVQLSELVGGGWVDRGSGRHDEVGMVIKDAVGLGLEQFATVALLPQGEFATFLRAKSEDRREVLERLFRTDRFRDIQEWLEGRRRAAAVEAGEALRLAQEQVRRVADSTDAVHLVGDGPRTLRELATGPLGDDPAGELELAAVIGDLADQLRAEGAAARDRLTDATMAADESRAALGEAKRRQATLDRAEQAGDALAALEEQRDTVESLRRELARAEAAGAVLPFARAVDAARRELAAVASGRRDAIAGLPSPALREQLHEASATQLDLLADQVDGHTDTVAGLAERLRVQATALTSLGQAGVAAREADEALQAASEVDQAARAEVEQVRARHTEAEQAASDLEAAKRSAALISQVAEALLAVQHRSSERDSTEQAAVRAARTVELATRAVVELSRRRAAGLAAELASGLTDGDPCPVCGSAEHPAPATAGIEDLPSAADVAEAERARSAAEENRAVAVAARAAAGASLDAATRTYDGALTACLADPVVLDGAQRSALALIDGVPPQGAAAMLTAAVDAATQRTHDARAAHALAATLATELATCEASAQTAATAAEAAVRRVELAAQTLHTAQATAQRAEADVQQAVAEHEGCPCLAGQPELSALPVAHGRVRAALSALRRSWADAAARERESAEAGLALEAAARERGFDDAEQALAAVRDAQQVQAGRAAIEAHGHETVQWRTVLAQPDVVEALAGGPVGLAEVEASHTAACEALARAQSESAIIDQAVALAGQRAPLALDAVAAAADRAARAREIKELADLVAGSSPANVLSMSLSSYVLAARLEEVVAHANERLARMTDGRFELRHTDAKAGGRSRSGLGLAVVDAWTGRQRDTATLSGGETFMASLALALGLGDAVRAEAGGLDLQTLFVDEGFGALDSDGALDNVMDVLDGLRDGGRVVGVVSHVSELRTRIPAQIKLIRTPTGSNVEVVTGRLVDA